MHTKIANLLLGLASAAMILFGASLPFMGTFMMSCIALAAGDYGDKDVAAGSYALFFLFIALVLIALASLVVSIISFATSKNARNSVYTGVQIGTIITDVICHIASLAGIITIGNFMRFDSDYLAMTVPNILGILFCIGWIVCTVINSVSSKKEAA
ncbi:MAG: hypothetical protein J6127_04080 [Clostridiales bacterium]|nr:hypothetical protein [Clostridiales bacterium]